MKIWFKITASLVVALMVAMTVSVAHQTAANAQEIQECGCATACEGSCGKRLLRKLGTRKTCCPSCDAEICQLKTDQAKEKKTCYKIEEKTVCIPAVRLPWQKCAPQTSRTRKVNVLKKHSYECPVCKYSWDVVKPEVAAPESNSETAPATEPTTQLRKKSIWPSLKREQKQTALPNRMPMTGTSATQPPSYSPPSYSPSSYFEYLNKQK